jgi:hypothetical protein
MSVTAVDSRAEGAWSARISGRVIGARWSGTVTTAERAAPHRLVLSSGDTRRNAWATALALAVADCVEWTLEGDLEGTCASMRRALRGDAIAGLSLRVSA